MMYRSKKRGEEEKEAASNKDDADYKELGWDNDEVWSVDTTEDAVAKRKQEEMATLATKSRKSKNVASSDPLKDGMFSLQIFVQKL